MKMTYRFLSVWLLVYPLFVGAQAPEKNGGQWLYDMILAHERLQAQSTHSQNNVGDIVSAAYINGFLQGVMRYEQDLTMKAAIAGASVKSNKNRDELVNYILYMGPSSCIGPGTSVEQLILSVKNYLSANPGSWSRSGLHISQKAIAESFPCN